MGKGRQAVPINPALPSLRKFLFRALIPNYQYPDFAAQLS